MDNNGKIAGLLYKSEFTVKAISLNKVHLTKRADFVLLFIIILNSIPLQG